MENAGDNSVFIHSPLFKDFFDGERVGDVRLAGFAELRFMRVGGNFDGALDAFGIGGFFIIGHYGKIIT